MKKNEVTAEQIETWVKVYAPSSRGVTVYVADKTERVEAIQLHNLATPENVTVLVTFLTDHISHTYLQHSGADRAEGYTIIWGHGGRAFRVWSLRHLSAAAGKPDEWYDSHGGRISNPNRARS